MQEKTVSSVVQVKKVRDSKFKEEEAVVRQVFLRRRGFLGRVGE